jgi:hypothetical protein
VRLPLGILALVITLTPPITAQPGRVFFGDLMHPVVIGEVWLIADSWYGNPGVLVATIQNGALTPRAATFSTSWEQPSPHRVVIGVSDKVAQTSGVAEVDEAYASSSYLKPFTALYVSPEIGEEKNGSGWPAALEGMGRKEADGLVLPKPTRRTIRLLFPDGKPLVNGRINVSLYGSNQNHCGLLGSIDLGNFVTDARGEIAVLATQSSLAIGHSYFEERNSGPAGIQFVERPYRMAGTEERMTLRERWALPQYDYQLTVRTSSGKPIAGAHLTACDLHEGCGDGCGPLTRKATDSSGALRFREADLRQFHPITVVNQAGEERPLTVPEMRELLTVHRADVVWE